ncbi:Swt1 family HEPN domain-containing protein [Sphingomonas sp. LB2R24]|uniref:Swt1 family HEPN domain-containing protein n=1 Tax=Sphingomonas sorbitolis TaxID=3096165 RepID=UPI002FCADFF9
MNEGEPYSFVFRGQLTEAALDRAGRRTRYDLSASVEDLRQTLGINVLDVDYVATAEKMSFVYIAVAAFENSVRELISRVLAEAAGEGWWENCVSDRVRTAAKNRQEAEEKVRWHVQRGDDPIRFTMLPNLAAIIENNFDNFEPYLPNVPWVKSVFEVVERSRNVIMHSGSLSDRDMARLGSLIRDWNSQVSI